MLNSVRKVATVGNLLGWKWLVKRLWYSLKLKCGIFARKCPVAGWDEISVPSGRCKHQAFFFDARRVLEDQERFIGWDRHSKTSVVKEADAICEGVFPFYSWNHREVGLPPNWHRNHYTGEQCPENVHWSSLHDFGFGDIKNVWELNRFSWAFILTRAYFRTGNEKYAETFSLLLNDWMEQNPPNQGVNWKCGQEVAFRMFAALWAWHAFQNLPGFVERSASAIRKLARASALRIDANIEYALQQDNNHGISEAVGIWTVGLQFPEFPESTTWIKKGKQLIERQAVSLVYPDGSCSQYSMNYERVMLDTLIWAIRMGQIHEVPLDSTVEDAVTRGSRFLWQSQDDISGMLPNYGPNDGALVLPLTSCDYRDYRPVLQLASMFLNKSRYYDEGNYDEGAYLMLGGDYSEEGLGSEKRSDLRAVTAGYYTLRSRDGFLFIRCGKHVHRPSHSDQLHVDVWWAGRNIINDCGSFSYNADPPFSHAFKGTEWHNTVNVDGRGQMDKVSRFLWAPWVTGNITKCQDGIVEGSHDGFQRLEDPVSYSRKIVRVRDIGFLVIDRLSGQSQPHRYDLRWNMAEEFVRIEDHMYMMEGVAGKQYLQLWANTPFEIEWQPTDGSYSSYYMQKAPCNLLTGQAVSLAITFATWIGKVPANLTFSSESGVVFQCPGLQTKMAIPDPQLVN